LKRNARINSIVQPWDVTATLFDLYSIPAPADLIGNSVLPLIRGEADDSSWLRDTACIGSLSEIQGTLAQAMTERWSYTTYQLETSPYLYDFETDPGCLNNLIGKEKDKAKELHQKLVAFMQAQNIDKSYIDGFTSP